MQNDINQSVEALDSITDSSVKDERAIKSRQYGQAVEYASFDRRVIASTIDLIFITIMMIPVSMVFNFFAYDGRSFFSLLSSAFGEKGRVIDLGEFWDFIVQYRILQKFLGAQFITFICIGAFFLPFWHKKNGATPGKMLTGCRIVSDTVENLSDLENPDKKIKSEQYYKRFLSYTISILPMGLGLIAMAFTAKRQALHDIIAGTVVIRIKGSKKIRKTQLS